MQIMCDLGLMCDLAGPEGRPQKSTILPFISLKLALHKPPATTPSQHEYLSIPSIILIHKMRSIQHQASQSRRR